MGEPGGGAVEVWPVELAVAPAGCFESFVMLGSSRIVRAGVGRGCCWWLVVGGYGYGWWLTGGRARAHACGYRIPFLVPFGVGFPVGYGNGCFMRSELENVGIFVREGRSDLLGVDSVVLADGGSADLGLFGYLVVLHVGADQELARVLVDADEPGALEVTEDRCDVVESGVCGHARPLAGQVREDAAVADVGLREQEQVEALVTGGECPPVVVTPDRALQLRVRPRHRATR